MKKHITLFISLLFAISIFAQMPVSDIKKKVHFDQLKQGILLIQLPDLENKKILKLRELGQNKAAKMEEKEIIKTREYIIKGFNEKFNFCNFYFFNAKDAKNIISGDYQGIFDSEMTPIKKFEKPPYIYIARHGKGNPNGEVYRYNGDGFQIRYVENETLQTIKYDNFFAGGINIFNTPSSLKRSIFKSIRKLNNKLNREIF